MSTPRPISSTCGTDSFTVGDKTYSAGDECGEGDDATTDTVVKLFVWPPQASNDTEPLEIRRHGLKIARLTVEDRDAEPTQFSDLRRQAPAAPGHHQIRFQREDAFEVQRRTAADQGQAERLPRIVAELADADDARTRASGEQEFGRVRRQADDALGGRQQRQHMPGVVLHRNRRGDGESYDQAQGEYESRPTLHQISRLSISRVAPSLAAARTTSGSPCARSLASGVCRSRRRRTEM